MKVSFLSLIALTTCCSVASFAMAQESKILRIGIIGCDTSHVPAFAKLINDPKAEGDLAKMEVVAAFPGGSSDIPSSRDRVEGFVKQLREMNVEICDSIPDLVKKVDAVLLESVDGRPHLEQALPVLQAKLPLFIDKPLAGSLEDCLAIQMAAQSNQARWFSSSSLRYSASVQAQRNHEQWPKNVIGAISWGPCPIEKTHPDLFWYGIHGVETLFTAMGQGCVSVTRTYQEGADVVTGIWKDGRIGTFRGIRDGKQDYGLVVIGKTSVDVGGKYDGYKPLVDQIAKFFLGGPVPIPEEETIEIFAFMQAAQLSKEQGGVPVKMDDVLKTAREKAAQRLKTLQK